MIDDGKQAAGNGSVKGEDVDLALLNLSLVQFMLLFASPAVL